MKIAPFQAKPDKDVTAGLLEVMDLNRQGKVVAFAFVVVTPESNRFFVTRDTNRCTLAQLVGEVEIMRDGLVEQIRERMGA